MDHLMQEMHDMFDDMPKDSNGHVTKEAFNEYIKDGNVKAYLKTRQLEVAAQRFFQVFELSGLKRKHIDCDEFVSGMMRLQGGALNADIIMLLSDVLRIHRKLSLVLKHQDPRLLLSRVSKSTIGNAESTFGFLEMRDTSMHSMGTAVYDDGIWLNDARSKARL